MITVLCGGVGGSRFLCALAAVVDPARITAIINTGDDDWFHGVYVSPDPDIVTYALAGEVDQERGWGLLRLAGLPHWATVLLAIVLLDLVIYAQHVLFHGVPALWRLHRMHHADLDVDVTTGVRFHPVEILLSIGIKLGAVAILGAPLLGVLLFEILLNVSSLFNHGNVRMPERLDRVARWLVVTPDMHRTHHSAVPSETNSNFGFNLPWWDRLFGTYRAAPAAGHEAMRLGLEQFRDPRDLRLDRMLLQPLAAEPLPYGRPT